MINLRELGELCAWPENFRPDGHDGFGGESFASWRNKHGRKLDHLPDEVLEQWIFRHWSESVARFIPLEGLECREERWNASAFIDNVGTVRGNEPYTPEYDYEVFSGSDGGGKLATAVALDQGQWDYAPIVLETDSGFIDWKHEHIERPYLLIEGHKRLRYLNALLHKGIVVQDQRVFVLRSPMLC